MLNLAKIIKPWKESGALNAQLNLYGFWNSTTFLTKSGGLGTVLRVEGIDYESLDKKSQINAVRHLEGALKILGPNYHIYQYLIKRNHPHIPFTKYGDPLIDNSIAQRMKFFEDKSDHLYQIDIYYVILYEGKRDKGGILQALSHLFSDPSTSIRELIKQFSGDAMTLFLKTELNEDAETLRHDTESFVHHLSQDTNIQILKMDQQFTFLRRLINFDEYRIIGKPKSTQYLDFQVANSTIEAERDHLRVGNHFVRILTMKEAPSETRPLILDAILKLDSTFTVCLEWNVLGPITARKVVKSRRKHHNVTKASASPAEQSSSNSQDRLVDEGLQADVNQLGLVQRELADGAQLGELSLTVVLSATTLRCLDDNAAQFASTMANVDGTLFPETYNQLNAFLATIPGNMAFNLRKSLFLNSNLADMSFLFTILMGNQRNKHLNSEYLAVLETDNKTPYYLNLHCGEIAHTLILGQTGSGKSFLCNFLLSNMQKLKPITYIFDIGGSFGSLTEIYGGAYINVGQESKDFHINPFCLEACDENFQFLYSFVKVLIESGGKYAVTLEDEKNIWFAIKSTYMLQPKNRCMSTFANLVGELKPHLSRWTYGGQYGWLFDNVEDSLTFSRFQTFNFQGWGDAADVLAALLFYVLHRANNEIVKAENAATFKAFLMDEAWLFLGNETIRAYVIKAQKTWRKHNAAMILATQNIEDLQKSGLLGMVSTSCPSKIFLANPDMDRELYAKEFHLNDTVIELIAGLIPPGEMVVHTPRLSKRVRLDVDSVSYWMSTNNSKDNVLKAQYFKRYGIEKGIEQLAIEHPFLPRGTR
jgi:type IV secretion system protein TrbE